MGLAAAYLSLNAWSGVSAAYAVESGQAWVDATLRMIRVLRAHSLRVSKSYYQLVRALDTGYTLGLPDGVDDGVDVTLELLRNRFADSVIAVADLGTGVVHGSTPDDVWLEQLLSGADIAGADANARSVNFGNTDLTAYLDELFKHFGSDDTVVNVDRFSWPTDLSAEQIADAFADQLRREALEAQADKVAKHNSNQDLSHEDYLAKIEDDHLSSGSRGAGVADWASVSAGRSLIAGAGRRDKRVRAVARGTGPSPCAWCAMLASRGFTYVSEGSAGFGGDGVSKWHLNCHCYPIVRWTTTAQLPAQNVYFQTQWPVVTKGYSGKAALNKWRQWLKQQRATTKS